MKHLFVPYELALKLKEKGFNESCLSKYSTTEKLDIASTFGITNSILIEGIDYQKYGWICTAPLYQQVIDWFREKHQIHIEIGLGKDEDKVWYNAYLFKIDMSYNYDSLVNFEEGYDTYYETLNKAIEEAIKLI